MNNLFGVFVCVWKAKREEKKIREMWKREN